MEQISKRNGQFNDIIARAQERGFQVEITANETDEYGEFVFAIISRYSGEVTNWVQLANSSCKIYVTSIFSNRTGRSSMKFQSSNGETVKNISKKLLTATLTSWISVDKVAA